MDKHIGEKYGVYTIKEVLPERAKDGHLLYRGECSCGESISGLLSYFVTHKNTNKCSHFTEIGDLKIRTGLIRDRRISQIYYGMLHRCYDVNDKNYKYYGAKGIGVCQAWINSPNLFEIWALNNGYADELTIDRIREYEDYSPDNCRWVDLLTNARFKSNTNYITATVTLSGKQWASLIPDIGVNRINKMMREHGAEETVKFIEKKLTDKRQEGANREFCQE